MKGFRPCTRLINGFFLTHFEDAYIVSLYGWDNSVRFTFSTHTERLKVAHIICSNTFEDLLTIGKVCENPIEATTFFKRKVEELNYCKLDNNLNNIDCSNLIQLTIEDFLQVEG